MKDGIIKGNGTSRKMKATLPATYEEFKQAAGAGEQTLDVMFNAPGWQQQPTLLNKENLGQDETMAVYNRGPEGTVDDLFQSVFAVGDIKVSTRTDLGDSWVLCNGEPSDRKAYPNLYSLLPKSQSLWDKTTYNFYTSLPLQVDRYLIDMNYNAGQYRYLDVVNKTLSEMITSPARTSTSTKIYFIDGIFVYCGFIGEGYYTTRDLSGNWVKRKYYPDYISSNAAMKFLQKVGDKYIAIFDEEEYSRRWIGITDNLETGTWTAYKLTDIRGVVESFFCIDNNWVYTFRNGSTYRIFYYEGETPPDDPSQWNVVMNSQIYRIKKIAGVYYLSGYNATHPSGFYKNNILDFENFGELVLQNITDFVNLGTTIVGYYSSKTGFSKVLGELVCKTEQGAGSLTQFFTYGKKLYACGYVDQNPAGERTVVLEVDEEHLEWALLPTISFDGAYAYIRGK